jgi:hypothetical protein
MGVMFGRRYMGVRHMRNGGPKGWGRKNGVRAIPHKGAAAKQ